MDEWTKVEEAAAFLRREAPGKPGIGIILGTGLGPLAEHIEQGAVVPYDRIPNFPVSTVAGHHGNLVFGTLGAKKVVAMQGRFHCYEGYSAAEVVFPVRVMKELGVSILVESNACGGLNPGYRRGDIVLIADHINLMGVNPLVGRHDDRFGPRFPDMIQPYDEALMDLAEQVALRDGQRLHRGVLVALTGPNLETKAEYRLLRLAGADMVCMSTVPEVIAAVQAGLRTVGFSVVTDMCLPDALEPASLEKILAVAAEAEPRLTRLVKELILTV